MTDARTRRLRALAELLRAETIASQEEATERLRAAGFAATQATVSRDLEQLGGNDGPGEIVGHQLADAARLDDVGPHDRQPFRRRRKLGRHDVVGMRRRDAVRPRRFGHELHVHLDDRAGRGAAERPGTARAGESESRESNCRECRSGPDRLCRGEPGAAPADAGPISRHLREHRVGPQELPGLGVAPGREVLSHYTTLHAGEVFEPLLFQNFITLSSVMIRRRAFERKLQARGLVQCGYCGTQFNALERLHDHPQARPVPDTPSAAMQAPQPSEPDFEIPVQAQDAAAMPQGDGDEGPEAIPAAEYAPAEATTGPQPYEDELAAVLLDEPERAKAPLWSRLLWGSGLLLLLLAILVQVLWFNRDDLLARYPRFVPLARQICERLACELVRDRDTASIALLNRDVRDHPRYEDTLLVNVTIENQADTIRPFPVIQLILFDPNGEVSGYRNFTPADYLDADIDREAGMRPGIPVHLVLELTGAGESAVSFEFRFL